MITSKKIPDANTTQKTLERIKKKKGEKNVIVDVLEEVPVDLYSQQREGFFQFRPYNYQKKRRQFLNSQ